eukprot:COSAG05_NODE_18_length_34957_cov_44.338115_21_plen_67_part_00
MGISSGQWLHAGTRRKTVWMSGDWNISDMGTKATDVPTVDKGSEWILSVARQKGSGSGSGRYAEAC